SGAVLNVLAGSDRALTGIRGAGGEILQRGTQLRPDAYSNQSGRPLTNWLDRSAFDLPALGTFGNVGRNSLIGPPSWAFDMAVSRAFNVRETQRVELRVEMFNVPNSFRPGNPNASLNSAQFGQIRTSQDPRIL